MRIALIAWGSVVWNPRDLPFHGTWQPSDLKLPIEFSRKSTDGRLTLVVDFKSGTELPMYIARSTRSDIQDAIADLRDREQTIYARIGWFNKSNGDKSSARRSDTDLEHAAHNAVAGPVKCWIKSTDYDAAIWTALASNYQQKLHAPFSVDHAIEHLSRLSGTEKRLAFDYISRAPELVQTSLRKKWIDHMSSNGG